MYLGLAGALLISLLLTVISVFLLRRKGPWGSGWTFFLVLFLTLCAVSIYITPIGPVYGGIAWIPLLVAGILLTILLIASMPDANNWRDESIKSTSETKRKDFEKPMGRFFWVLIILLAMAIMIGMINPQKAL